MDMNDILLSGEEEASFEEIEHTADWALHVRGKSIETLFRNAALGMLRLIRPIPRSGKTQTRTVRLTAVDNETLLVAWLEELLFNMETRNVTYTGIEIHSVENCCLVAHVVEISLEKVTKEIKAVTFHDLNISATREGFEATVVFDV